MSAKKKILIAAGAALLAGAAWFGAIFLRVNKTMKLRAGAERLLSEAIKEKDAAKAKAALAAFEAVVERAPADWYPNYSNLFSAARLSGDFVPAERAFARMIAARERAIFKKGSFPDVRWHRAAAYYGSTRFELKMEPRDKAIYEGDEKLLLPASKEAWEAYEQAVAVSKWRELDLAGMAEPLDLLQGIAKDEKGINDNARIAEQFRVSVPKWTARPELARAHAIYLQGLNKFQAKDLEAARERLLEAARLDGAHPHARGVLAFVEADSKNDAAARQHAEAALALFGDPARLDERDRQAVADLRGVIDEVEKRAAAAAAADKKARKPGKKRRK
jgi:hypothetical protein